MYPRQLLSMKNTILGTFPYGWPHQRKTLRSGEMHERGAGQDQKLDTRLLCMHVHLGPVWVAIDYYSLDHELGLY